MKTIVITGASGNMGKEVLREIYTLPGVKVRILVYEASRKFLNEVKRKYENTEIVVGNIADEAVCKKLVDDADYVINCAAVIPPKSDKSPEKAIECNYYGVKSLLDAIKLQKKAPKLIHISTVALYGNRNYLHPWGRVGDPLMPSIFDPYSRSKLFGERLVLESGLEHWAVLRQTGILHDRMLTDNMSDGLMFHTCLNTPFEWVTAKDSGVLLKNIVKKDIAGKNENFWRKVYNIGGGARNRNTGFDTFNDGFSVIGGSAKTFLNPAWHATRNFHGLWFYDSDVLEKEFGFQNQCFTDYWQEILKAHPYYKVAKIIPPVIIRKLAIERLLTNYNSPAKWIKSGDEAKVNAYFYDGKAATSDWKKFPLLSEGKTENGNIDYENLKDISKVKQNGLLLSHGFDESKAIEELDIEDMRQAAAFRGGKCLSESMNKGDLYTPLYWECSEGHRFFATPYTVLFAGHWCEDCFKGGWKYDVLAKSNPFYAQVYYDTHSKKENKIYYVADGKSYCKEAA